MKKSLTTIGLLLCLFSAASVHAEIGPMNYQGRLLDSNGVPVNGSLTFVVRVWDAPTGGSTPDYEETHSSVAVSDGVYSFLVSTGTPSAGYEDAWDINLWNKAELYLEIEVGGETLSPRARIAAAPFAFQANLALTTNDALALGGKTAAEYDSILEEICVAGKGKWLDKNVGNERCLGVGTDLSGLNINNFDFTNDYTDLDLSKANLTNTLINNSPDFTGTVFNGNTMTPVGVTAGNFNSVVMDGVVFTGPVTAVTWDLTNATLKNMNLSKLDLSGATLTGLSAAFLSGCPNALPVKWLCLEHSSGSNTYFLVGDNANLSAGSAITALQFGASYLDVDNNVFDDLSIILDGVKFDGNIITQTFVNVTLDNVSFDYATLRNTAFTKKLENSSFENATLDNVDFTIENFEGNSFNSARMSDIKLDCSVRCLSNNFTNARIKNFYLTKTGEAFTGLNDFSNAILEDMHFDLVGGQFFTNTIIHGAYFGFTGGSILNGAEFIGGAVFGDLSGFALSNAVSFESVDLQGADFTGVNLSNSANVVFNGDNKWFGATCPDGSLVIAANGDCTGHLVP